MKVIAAAAAVAMTLAAPALAQLYKKQLAPQSLPAIRAVAKRNFTLPPKLTMAQRNLAIKSITGNPTATVATTEPVYFSASMQAGDSNIEYYKAEDVTLGEMFSLMQPGGAVTLGLPGVGTKPAQGIWLFDCAIGATSLTWSGHSSDGKATNGTYRLGGSVPVSGSRAVFAVDMSLLDSSYVRIEAGDPTLWAFGYCSATPAK